MIVSPISIKGGAAKRPLRHFDTRSANGRLVFNLFGSFAQFERDLISKRTKAGLQAARSRDHQGGRPAALDDKQRKELRRLHRKGDRTIRQLCELFAISKTTLYRNLKQ